jgi:hypothetical protein
MGKFEEPLKHWSHALKSGRQFVVTPSGHVKSGPAMGVLVQESSHSLVCPRRHCMLCCKVTTKLTA